MKQGILQRLGARWPQGLVLLLVVLADQLSKLWIVRTFAFHQRREIIAGFFELTHTMNTGGVWGLGRGLPELARILIFLALPAAITLAAVWYSLSLPLEQRLRQFSVALVVGGAIGNLIDRCRLSGVIDFLVFHWKDHYWPAFNLADSAICVGIVILMLTTVFERDPASDSEAAPIADSVD